VGLQARHDLPALKMGQRGANLRHRTPLPLVEGRSNSLRPSIQPCLVNCMIVFHSGTGELLQLQNYVLVWCFLLQKGSFGELTCQEKSLKVLSTAEGRPDVSEERKISASSAEPQMRETKIESLAFELRSL
jgi:hypothetical protein